MRSVVACVVVMACAGFSPASCAKGCKACAGSGDDFARVSSSADDFGRMRASRFSDDLARTRAGGIAAGIDDGTIYATRASLDDAVASLPEATGAISPLAHAQTPGGLAIKHNTSGRSFGRDYARSIDKLELRADQHEMLLEAFDHVQTAIELIVDVASVDAQPPPLTTADRRRLEVAARSLEAEFGRTLAPTQRAMLLVTLGSPTVIAYRLATERPITKHPEPR